MVYKVPITGTKKHPIAYVSQLPFSLANIMYLI